MYEHLTEYGRHSRCRGGLRVNSCGRLAALLLLTASLSGCLGTVVGTAVDVTLEVAKVPFKVAGAAIDVVTDDEEDE